MTTVTCGEHLLQILSLTVGWESLLSRRLLSRQRHTSHIGRTSLQRACLQPMCSCARLVWGSCDPGLCGLAASGDPHKMRMDRFSPILSESDLALITLFSVYHSICLSRAEIVKKVFKSIQSYYQMLVLPLSGNSGRKQTNKITLPGRSVYLSNVKRLKALSISTFVDTHAV